MFAADSTARKATLTGLLAPLLWGMSVGLVRGISEDFGLARGLMLLYGISVVFLLFILGRPNLSVYPKKYLYFGIPAANLCSICFGLSLALSDGGSQTMEVGMVNYLWPCLTVVFAVLFNGQKARWWIVPGFFVTIAGIVTVLAGDAGFDPASFAANMQRNPWSYGLAFVGAVAWAGFCSMTRAWARGENPVIVIFVIDFVIFFVLWLFGVGGEPQTIGWKGVVSAVLGAMAVGGAYAAWTYGTMKGNLTLLAIASYFTPVLSCVFATFWIGADLTLSFWKGVALVVTGSLVCWHATRGSAPATSDEVSTEDRGAPLKRAPASSKA